MQGSAVIGSQGVSAYLLVYFYGVQSLRKQPIIHSHCQQHFIGAQSSTSNCFDDFFSKSTQTAVGICISTTVLLQI